MNSPSKLLLIAAIAALAPAWTQAADGFDRYQVILEREPFGAPPPPPVAPAPPPPEEEPPWAKMYRLCSVYETEDQEVKVALVDNKEHKPVMLTLGEEPVQGIALISVNLVDEEAVLTKDGQQVIMKMEASKTPPPKVRTPPRTVPRPGSSRATPTRPTAATPPSKPTASRGAIRAVRR